ncbi:MAG: protease pro-enzyme activation domain-containing protein, partial [bacterium]|nr:protease pro-enzyme activation domain-containing protein [bacterium]
MFKLKKIALLVLPYSLMVVNSFANHNDILLAIPSPGFNLISQATLLAPMSPNAKINFTAWLNIRNKHELDKLVQDVYDSNSPRYQQFLTPTLYEQQFAPSPNTEDKVLKFFTGHGMQARLFNHSVRITGTVKQIEQALHVQINYYGFHNERIHAPANAPQLNPEIGQYISEITGLNTIPLYHSNMEHLEKTAKKVSNLKFIWNTFLPSAIPTDSSLQGFSGAHLAKTYNLSNIPTINGTPIDGAGQTLVIVDNCGSNDAEQILKDANHYFKINGIKPFVTSG